MNRELIDAFASRFINHKSAYYRQWFNGTDYGYKAVYEPLTRKVIGDHLAGHVTVSVPALNQQNIGRWIAFDSDTENGTLDTLETFLKNHQWHCIREGIRPERDGHLWLLFDSFINGEHLVTLASAMVRLAGVKNSGIEIFPKQAKAQRLASGVRLPLGIHRKPGASNCRGWFEVPQKDITAQLQWLAGQSLNSAAAAIELAKEHQPIELPLVLSKRANKSHTGAANKITFEAAIKLTAAKSGSSDWWRGHCPASGHKNGDKNPSLSIKEADDGSAIVKCWTGCMPRDIYACLARMVA